MKGFTADWLEARQEGRAHTPKAPTPKTGPGNALSSPRTDADAPAGPNARAEWAARWRAGESVFLVRYHHAGRSRLLCCDAEQLQRVFARVHRAHSHAVYVFTEPEPAHE